MYCFCLGCVVFFIVVWEVLSDLVWFLYCFYDCYVRFLCCCGRGVFGVFFVGLLAIWDWSCPSRNCRGLSGFLGD